MKRGSKREALITAGILLAVSTVLAISSTFAWLGVSRIPFISDVGLSVITDAAVFAARDEGGKPGEWVSDLNLSADFEAFTPLKPVTYTDVGLAAGLHEAKSWSKVIYAEDGRTSGLVPLEDKNLNVQIVDEDSSAERAEAEEDGYMYMVEFWLKSQGGSGELKLSDAIETVDGQMGPGTYVVGKPVWNEAELKHENHGHGSEYSLRFAFECTPYVQDPNTGELTKSGDSRFTVYEPNAQFNTEGGYEGIYVESTETDEKGKTVPVVLVPMNGATGEQKKVIVQKASTWEDQTPVLNDTVNYKAGSFYTNPGICALENDSLVHVKLFVWMDGEDAQCIASNVAEEVSAIANFMFGVVDTHEDTGIERR